MDTDHTPQPPETQGNSTPPPPAGNPQAVTTAKHRADTDGKTATGNPPTPAPAASGEKSGSPATPPADAQEVKSPAAAQEVTSPPAAQEVTLPSATAHGKTVQGAADNAAADPVGTVTDAPAFTDEVESSGRYYAFGPYKRAAAGHEDGLVVLAMRLPYKLVQRETGFFLLVESEHKAAIAEQIYIARQERRRWKKLRTAMSTPLPQDAPGSPYTLVVYAVLLTAFFLWQHSTGSAANAIGVMNNRLVLGGEWWRLFTALTLHADVGHLVSNIVSGVALGLLANRTFGSGMAWLAALTGGALGNLLTAWLYFPQPHSNYGASTAIFAILGLLTGHALLTTLNTHGRRQWRQYQIPLLAGVAVLALTGIGDTQTDVVAHVCGFVVGIPLGIAGGWLRLRNGQENARQWPYHAITLALLAAAWLLAVNAH